MAGSATNIGGQKIGWKYSTPLEAEYLNTVLGGVTTAGLVSRPQITVGSVGETSAIATLSKFSLFIVPEDCTDESNLVKFTFTETSSITITPSTVAIGFEYSFANDGVLSSEWYGNFVALTSSTVSNYKGVIIATCIYDSVKGYSVSTNGADISNVLLVKEGWNPQCWISVVSPRKTVCTSTKLKIQIRKNNDEFRGYINDVTLGISKYYGYIIDVDYNNYIGTNCIHYSHSRFSFEKFNSENSAEYSFAMVTLPSNKLPNQCTIEPVINSHHMTPDGSVNTDSIKDNAVTISKLAADCGTPTSYTFDETTGTLTITALR